MNVKELKEILGAYKGYEVLVVSRHAGTLEYFKEFRTVQQYSNGILETNKRYIIICSLPLRLITKMPYNVRHIFIIEFDIRGREIGISELEKHSEVIHLERMIENPEVCRAGYASDFYFPTNPTT